ncbi:MAG: RNA polymerase subunit sigma-70 [Bacteroidetes bacterium]|nr:MAG: RNA polymerase subunit sigma-70 [Bacteroidota bacterium]
MISNNRIIEECKAGKHSAFRELYDSYASRMLGVCYRYSRNMNDAEDILQESFIKIFQNIRNYKGSGSFEGWMRRIMVNTALNHYKANLKHSYQDELHENYNDHVSNEDAELMLEDRIPQQEIIEIIRTLPEGYKMIFNMYVLDGLTHKEIAGALNISDNTSKSQLSKSRRMLRKLIAEKYGAQLHNII